MVCASLVAGGAAGDVLVGGAGQDVLQGREGRDLLLGGTGADFLYGYTSLAGPADSDNFLVTDLFSGDHSLAMLQDLASRWSSGDSLAGRSAASISHKESRIRSQPTASCVWL